MLSKRIKKFTMQHVIIIRHGERLDNVDYNWAVRSSRPYDPPITNAGEKEVKTAAERFKDAVCLNIDTRYV